MATKQDFANALGDIKSRLSLMKTDVGNLQYVVKDEGKVSEADGYRIQKSAAEVLDACNRLVNLTESD